MLDLGRGFFPDGERHGFIALPARRLKGEQREAAIARDDPVLHPLITPRSDAAMNASSSSTSAHGGTSSRMRSTACEVFSPPRVSKRKAVCSDSIAALSKPRRVRPMAF